MYLLFQLRTVQKRIIIIIIIIIITFKQMERVYWFHYYMYLLFQLRTVQKRIIIIIIITFFSFLKSRCKDYNANGSSSSSTGVL